MAMKNGQVETKPKTQPAITELIKQYMITYRHPLKIFGLDGTKEYAEKVASHLKIGLSKHEETKFEDDECYLQSVDGPEGNVRGHNAFVIQSLYSDNKESVADKFMKLAVFIGSLRSASAHEITVVIPHLAWARQDRKTKSRAPVTTKIIAVMLESVGIDRALFVDVHNLSAEQNAFSLRCPTDYLEAKYLHAEWCADRMKHMNKIAILVPDVGGYPRGDRFATALQRKLAEKKWTGQITVAVFGKLRVDGKVKGDSINGDIQDANVILYDDMISTGSTAVKAGKAVEKHGGKLEYICCTHGLFVGRANQLLGELDTKIVIADTVSPWRLNEENQKKVHVVSTTKLVADAIWKIHSGTGSISDLLTK